MSATPRTVRAVGFHEYGDAGVLEMVDVEVPPPAPGTVRVRTVATPVNPADILFREGGVARLVGERPRPFVPGLEFSGVVEAVGDGVDLVPGESVLGVTTFIDSGRGCHAELVVVDAADVARVPEGLDLVAASTLPMSALTALATLDTLDVPRGGTLLVLGASGAVGAYVVQLARPRGLTVVAVADPRHHDALRRWGADHCLAKESWHEAMGSVAPDGVDAAVDTAVLGGEVAPFVRSGCGLALMRPMAPADRETAEEAGVDVHLISVRAYQGDPTRLQSLVDMAATGALELRVARMLPPVEAATAHRLVDAGGLWGRVVLTWG